MEFDEARALEELKHENSMEELREKAKLERETEQLKAEQNLRLEEAKAKNGKKTEWLRIGGKVVAGVILAGVGFGLNCLADRIGVPRKNVPRNIDK